MRSVSGLRGEAQTIKDKALQRMTTTGTPGGRYRPDDKLLAFLDSL